MLELASALAGYRKKEKRVKLSQTACAAAKQASPRRPNHRIKPNSEPSPELDLRPPPLGRRHSKPAAPAQATHEPIRLAAAGSGKVAELGANDHTRIGIRKPTISIFGCFKPRMEAKGPPCFGLRRTEWVTKSLFSRDRGSE
jgi:hypothetical protein